MKRARSSAAAADKATQAAWRAGGESGLRGRPEGGGAREEEALIEANFGGEGGGPRVLKEREWSGEGDEEGLGVR